MMVFWYLVLCALFLVQPGTKHEYKEQSTKNRPLPSSFPLRGCLPFLFFVETLLIFLQPGFEIVRGFFEFVAVEQAAPQRFEERAGANVVGQLFVCLLVSTFRDRDEKLFVKRR